MLVPEGDTLALAASLVGDAIGGDRPVDIDIVSANHGDLDRVTYRCPTCQRPSR